MKVFYPAAAAALLAMTGAAQADRASADRCAAALPAASKTFYQAALPKVLGGEAPKDALTDVARPMVMGGQMSRDAARAAAEAAGPCLQQAR